MGTESASLHEVLPGEVISDQIKLFSKQTLLFKKRKYIYLCVVNACRSLAWCILFVTTRTIVKRSPALYRPCHFNTRGNFMTNTSRPVFIQFMRQMPILTEDFSSSGHLRNTTLHVSSRPSFACSKVRYVQDAYY